VNENLCDYEQARNVLEECLAIRRSLGDRLGVGHALFWLSLVLDKLGHYEQSAGLARKSIAICRELDDRAGVADGQMKLANNLILRGRFADAQPMLEEAAAAHNELGMRYWYAVGIGMLAWTKARLALYEEARELSADARSLYTEIGDREGMAVSIWGLAEIALAEQAYGDAKDLLDVSVIDLREIGQRVFLSQALAELASAERALGQLPEAQFHLREALQIAAGIEAQQPKLFSVAHFALHLAARGQFERAVELYALASRYPYIGNSRFWDDVAGKRIAAAADHLPPDAVAAAQERGRTRDLDATVAELVAELGREACGAAYQNGFQDDS
jgi:tetratricopeptide (TPR) repeat protein